MHHMNNTQTNTEPLVTIQNHMQYSNSKKPDEHHMNSYAHSNNMNPSKPLNHTNSINRCAAHGMVLHRAAAMLPRTSGKASLSGSHMCFYMVCDPPRTLDRTTPEKNNT